MRDCFTVKRGCATALLILLFLLQGCGRADGKEGKKPPEFDGLTFLYEEENRYADGFQIYRYADGRAAIRTTDDRLYLIVPEGGRTPDSLPPETTVICQPVKNIYLAATSAMALFDALDALDAVSFSGTDRDGWYIEHAKEAMESGAIRFAGKYSQPDYEALLDGDCDLAVESMMLFHAPEVEEKLKALSIPVFIDESSTENHPLGRSEWIRVYGLLLQKETEAEAFFEEQCAVLDGLSDFENTGKTVAFFSVNSAGSVVVRRTRDYIPQMIELAGGVYIFDDKKSEDEDSLNGSVTISMEEFYAAARDADFLVYNGTIEEPLSSLSDLLKKNEVFADFKAVREGHVFTTDRSMYQATDIMAELIMDFHRMLTGDDGELVFLSNII